MARATTYFKDLDEKLTWRRAEHVRRDLGTGAWWAVEPYQQGRKFAFWYLREIAKYQLPNEAELVEMLLAHGARQSSYYGAGVQSACRVWYRADDIRAGLKAKRVAIKCFGYAMRCPKPLQTAWILRGLLQWRDAASLLRDERRRRVSLVSELTNVLERNHTAPIPVMTLEAIWAALRAQ